MATSIDSTMGFNIEGPGGGSKPSVKIDSTQSEVFPTPSANEGGGDRGANRFPSVSKPETPGIINSVFYDDLMGNPTTLDSTLQSPLEIKFGK